MGIQFDFSGKNVLITGAERGIGLAIAKAFAKCGANIIIAGIMEEEFQNAKQEIEKENVELLVLGLPKNMNNTIGPRGETTLEFKEKL